MYGDQFRSPGRDDRQEGTPGQTGPAAARSEDVKVAGSLGMPPGFYDASVREDAPGPQGPGAPDGNATTAYDMGAPSEPGTSYEQPGNHYDTGVPHEADATSAMPPHFGGADAPPAPDFEDMRRAPRTSKKRVIRFAAVAAAVAVVGGGGAAWAVSGGSGGTPQAAAPQTQAQMPASVPLTDAQRKDAEDKRRTELKKRASRAARDQLVRPRLLAKGTPPPTPTPKPSNSSAPASASGTAGDPVPAGEAQQIARGMLSSFGWSPSTQFGCLVNLWNRESGWNTHAANPSGAYGIPQALPGSKMASAGPDWQNNATTQIKWGLGYIRDRYSSPCGAWGHSQSTGWY